MYEIIRDVIVSGRYELSAMLKKIDTVWVQGDITDEQRNELVKLAQDNADPEKSYAPLQLQIEELFGIIGDLGNSIKSVTDRVTKLEGGEVKPEPPLEEYPEYRQPTGAHDAYHKDDKVTYNGKKYICIAPEGVAVVWNPDEYPAYWKLVE